MFETWHPNNLKVFGTIGLDTINILEYGKQSYILISLSCLERRASSFHQCQGKLGFRGDEKNQCVKVSLSWRWLCWEESGEVRVEENSWVFNVWTISVFLGIQYQNTLRKIGMVKIMVNIAEFLFFAGSKMKKERSANRIF